MTEEQSKRLENLRGLVRGIQSTPNLEERVNLMEEALGEIAWLLGDIAYDALGPPPAHDRMEE